VSIGRIGLALVAFAVSGYAQNAVIDLVESAEERRQFVAIHEERDALRKRSLASDFLRRFPRSFLTAQALEAAAKASADMEDHSSAIAFARQSLRIYPENAGLRTPLAAWLYRRGDRAGARAEAEEALRLLDLFLSPSGAVRDSLREVALAVAARRPAAKPAEARNGELAGSPVCANCHKDVYAAWRKTGMANMLRPVAEAKVIGDFGSGASGEFRTGVTDRPYIEIKRRNGEWDRYRVDFTIGSKWQQAYATRAASGNLHVLPLQYNALTKQWLNYWKTIDPPASERAETRDFHRMRRVTSYQENCAPCHTSQARENGYAEAGVNCEMCHGGSAAHARGNPAAFRFGKAKAEESVRVCAQCHAQSAQRDAPGRFPPFYRRRPYVEFAPRAFYRDGRFRETTFIVEAFERSACYRKGGATCVSCHDPHPSDAATNAKSLKFGGGDGMCTQCHASHDSMRHAKHPSASEGARCAACHMPKIMGALLFQAGSHQIDEKPSAEFTARFGPAESPNACLLCHKDKDDTWLREQLRSWR
jgi:tetratricopeptide (TPR) repeat protein